MQKLNIPVWYIGISSPSASSRINVPETGEVLSSSNVSLRDTLFRAEIQMICLHQKIIEIVKKQLVNSKLTLVLPDDCVLSLALNSKDAAFNLIVGLEEEFVLDTGAEDGVDDIAFTGDE